VGEHVHAYRDKVVGVFVRFRAASSGFPEASDFVLQNHFFLCIDIK
jgi:hypothetical protein